MGRKLTWSLGNKLQLALLIIGLALLGVGLADLIVQKQIVLRNAVYDGRPVFYTPDGPIKREELLGAVNKIRAEHSLPDLIPDNRLDWVAWKRGEELAKEGVFSHGSGIKYTEFLPVAFYNYSSVAENLAIGYDNPGEIVQAWLRSEPHAKVLLTGKMVDAGLASSEGKFNGVYQTVIVMIVGKEKELALLK